MRGDYDLVPQNHFQGMRSHFDEMDRMTEKMMNNFGMPKMDMSNILLAFKFEKLSIYIVMPFGGRDPFSSEPFFADSGFRRMDKMMQEMRSDMKKAFSGR